ncbi:amidohydrolase family protein [Nocardia sp. NPDC048505]|uniref:N-acyl-D-amino-acid deacylase family protein n=1 Tax=unclassified Nocardia TaxID=2637762 RepID=UPI0033F132FA
MTNGQTVGNTVTFDVLIRGGTVFDGTGGPGYRADIGIAGGRIRVLGDLAGVRAATEVDATSRYVLPGFIDAHVHGESAVLDPAVQLASLRQGVTTFVLGQDGLSFAPATPAALRWVARYFAAVNGPVPPALTCSDAGVTVAELLSCYHHTTAVNTAYLVPHGTVRYSVMGGSPLAPDAGQLAAMVALVEQGLEQGAVGVSSGLGYLPGRFADAEELGALCAPAARRGLPYVTHMRTYGDAADKGMSEACAIGRISGAAVHISHYHGPGEMLAGLVDTARAAGQDVTFDTYPYLRGCSILAKMLPEWLATADLDGTLDALSDRSVRELLDTRFDESRWHGCILAHVPGRYHWAEGLPLDIAARWAGRRPAAFCADLLIDAELDVGIVFDYPERALEDSVRCLLRHEAHMGGSDGIYLGGRPHPRGYGAFARMLARHCRELGDWTWAQAAVHLAARPARRFRLTDRGVLARGKAADLVVLDPRTVRDRAGYAAPREPAAGIDDVVVGGVPVLTGGRRTGRLPGTVLSAC